jgi:hypothetical protein
MSTDELQLRVTLKNQVSTPLKELTGEIRSLVSELKNTGASARSTGASVKELATGFALGTVAVQALKSTLELTKKEFKDSIDAAKGYQMAMLGLSSVAGAFGEDQERARQAAKDLVSDGLLNIADAARGLKTLMAGGLGLEDSIEMMKAYKDFAAFGRAETISFSQAVGNLAESFLTENAMIGNLSGLQENYSYIVQKGAAVLGKEEKELTKTERALAKKIGTLLISQRATGDAARYAETYMGAESSLEQAIYNLHVTMGSLLLPSMRLVNKEIKDQILSIDGGLTPVAKELSSNLVVLVSMIRLVISSLQLLASINAEDFFQSMTRGAINATKELGGIPGILVGIADAMNVFGTKELSDPFGDFRSKVNEIQSDMGKALANIEDFGLDIQDPVRTAVDRTEEEVDKEAEKIAEKLAKAFKEFTSRMKEATKSYKQSIKEAVIEHVSAVKELKEELQDLTEDYEKDLKELKEDFDKTMLDIEESHKEKVEDIKKQVEDEKESMIEAQQDVRDEYEETITAFKQMMEERITSLQAQLDKELIKGDKANQEKVSSLKEYIDKEKKALEDQLAKKEAALNSELESVASTYQDKINELDSELEEENKSYQDSINEQTSLYSKQTEEIKSEYEERLEDLEDELEEEYDLQKKYSKEFSKYKDAVAEDDIARIKRVYEEAKSAAQEYYSNQVQEITKESGGSASSSSYSLSEYFGGKDTSAYKKYKEGQQAGKWSDLTDYIAQGGTPTENPYADGGVVTVPTRALIGEAGPEAVVPLTNPTRAREVMNEAGIGSIYITAPITVVSSEVDIDMLLERIAFKANKGLR